MKIALIGHGKMGKTVERLASARGHSVAALIDSRLEKGESAARVLLEETDLCIDFSHQDAVERHLDLCIAAKKPLVIGTTGWYERIDAVRKKVEHSPIAVLASPNFSIGVNLFKRAVAAAAALFAPFSLFDVAGLEIHHTEKSDTPSGTARALIAELMKAYPHKKQLLLQSPERKLKREELHFASLRVGQDPGTHQIFFDSPFEQITLTHRARNREGFAEGALLAAEYLVGKKGFFTMDDFLTWICKDFTQP